MKWEDARESSNVEDRRGESGGVGGGGGGGIGVGGGSLGLGTIVILGLISYALGIDPRVLIGGAEMVENVRHGGQTQQYDQSSQPQRQTGTPSDQMGKFVAAILGENEDVWKDVLPAQKGVQFQNPKLVLFDGATESACGTAQSAMGPFYCPKDRKIYLDTSFFQEMQRKLGGGGDFAYAYVVSHEMGHHIQNLLGILPKVQHAQQAAQSQGQANGYSVRLELQADCFAGVWGGECEQEVEQHRHRRHSKGDQHSAGDRRRSSSAGVAGTGGARQLHPWLVGAAREVASVRFAVWPDRQLQYFRTVALKLYCARPQRLGVRLLGQLVQRDLLIGKPDGQ